MTVDLHLHTTASDGSFTPSEVVNKAVQLGLDVIAITDHDTVGGIPEAKAEAFDKDLEVISGIELNTELFDLEIHILGYYIDDNNLALQNELKKLRTARYDRIEKMIKKLGDRGIEIDFDYVCQLAGDNNLSRVHLAQAIVERGYVYQISEAFDEYIGKGCSSYVSRYKLTPRRAIELIKAAGGIPVLAHPALLERDELISEFITDGLVGIEVYHSEHSQSDVRHYKHLAQKYDLVITGGSDCHGAYKDNVLLGSVEVPDKVVRDLKQNQREGGSGLACSSLNQNFNYL
ncbi:PHP domain-containing protein [Acetohalobium arabaticum]|uniref:PHP domain protein n=1 Tax=Acetohalobium arabaticum (strain ATCC 49924 / DSM 5501 / Z-7288) TaxID=574087 RepID=D9QR38_ACEAZ|nr:PHP domain-containing protein [Acetohalobium arabaticum]ADL12979.1 PHP domain protein [Acetohalobium arabaticum DSM 5501]